MTKTFKLSEQSDMHFTRSPLDDGGMVQSEDATLHKTNGEGILLNRNKRHDY
jgi:hypothetical protein